jgi:transcriptional regulator with XRE-family HTH domain
MLRRATVLLHHMTRRWEVSVSEARGVADAIRDARAGVPGVVGLSLRDVAERSGISAATINRIEKGLVDSPSAETLISIARGLGRNPFFLLLLSGRVSESEARRQLLEMFEEGSEVHDEWQDQAEAIRNGLRSPEWPLEELHELAYELFVGGEISEIARDDAFLLMAADGFGNEQMREIARLLAAVSHERRERVVEYLRDQVELSRRDYVRGQAEFELTQNAEMGGTRTALNPADAGGSR